MILCIGTTPAAQRVMVFSRLAQGQVNRARLTLDGAAGKSVNVAKVLKTLGERPYALGFIGGDRGNLIQAQLQSLGIESEFVRVMPETRECVTIIDESTGEQTELVQESAPVTVQEYLKLVEIARNQLTNCRAVILSGTIAAGGPQDLYQSFVEMAHQGGVLSVVDAQKEALTLALKAKPDLVKPNRAELASTMGRQLDNENSLREAMIELSSLGAKRIVITAGKDPTWAYDGTEFFRIHSPTIRAINAIGSGDSFTAALTWRLLHGDSLGEACRWAAAAGAANALTLMPGELDWATVQRLAKSALVERR